MQFTIHKFIYSLFFGGGLEPIPSSYLKNLICHKCPKLPREATKAQFKCWCSTGDWSKKVDASFECLRLAWVVSGDYRESFLACACTRQGHNSLGCFMMDRFYIWFCKCSFLIFLLVLVIGFFCFNLKYFLCGKFFKKHKKDFL